MATSTPLVENVITKFSHKSDVGLLICMLQRSLQYRLTSRPIMCCRLSRYKLAFNDNVLSVRPSVRFHVDDFLADWSHLSYSVVCPSFFRL